MGPLGRRQAASLSVAGAQHCRIEASFAARLDQAVIDNAIDEWRGRLCACVRARGGHFEQLL